MHRKIKQSILSFLSKYWFFIPALLVYIIFLIYPVIYSLILNFYEWDGLSQIRTYIGFGNYIKFIKDPVSILALKNNLTWIIISLLIPVSIGLILSICLDRPLKGKILYRTIFYLPNILPLVAVATIWRWIYNPIFGALNTLLKLIGFSNLRHAWLSEPNIALYSIIITAIWASVGFPMLLFLAGLQNIPKELYEAAKIDGASEIQSIKYITVPLLRETFVIIVSTTIANSIKVFDLVYVMTMGGPARMTQVLGTWMYFNTFLYSRAGYGATIACIMTVLTFIISIPYIRIMSKKRIEGT